MNKLKLKHRRNNVLALVGAGFGVFAYLFAFILGLLSLVYNDLPLDSLFNNTTSRAVILSVIAGFIISLVWGVVAFKVPPRYYRYGAFFINILLLVVTGVYLGKLIRHFQSSFDNVTVDTIGAVAYVFLFLTAAFIIVMIILAILDLFSCFHRGKADQMALIYEQKMLEKQKEEKRKYEEIQAEKDAEKARIRDENAKKQEMYNRDVNRIKLDSPLHPELVFNFNFDYTTAPTPHPLTAEEQVYALAHLNELYKAGVLNEHELAAYKKRIIARDIKEETK